MVTDPDSPMRRRELIALLGTGSAVALAGCGGGGDGGDGGATPTSAPTSTPTATPQPGVPAAYETATALGGQQRNPDALSSQSAVEYQEEPSGDEQCSNCTYYIEDKNGDGMGACAIVEGTIDPAGWCVSYARYEGAATPTATAAGAVEPVSVPADASCPVCGMTSANFPDWNAQVVHEDDTRGFFCTSGCATTYYAATDRFAETDAPIAGLWVRDFDTGELVDATGAYYALETDSDRVDDPMRLNPAAFASRDAAVAYVEAVDYLTEDDVVELSAFDRDLAAQYRGRFLEG
jgi:nitrous oxide reductase accessory protein NosL